MNVLIIGPAFPLRGGPAQFNENLCRALNREGHQAQIISYSLQYPNFLFPGSTQFETSGRAPDDIKIHTKINTVNPFNWLRVAFFIKKMKPDVVLFRFWLPFFGPSLGTIGRLVKMNTNIKVIALTDNVLPHEKRPGDTLFTRYFVKSCDGFMTMSQKVYNDLSLFTKLPTKIYTPHPLYETYGEPVSKIEARQKLGFSTDDKIILFFGLIRKYKGLDILLESMSDERIKKMNIKLVVAGEFYEDAAFYHDLIREKKITESVLLHTQFIPNELVKYYFCAADLVAQTYRNATNSGVTMVGYYYEKPMLVTAVGGLSEIVPHGQAGYVVEVDTNQIADAIVDYFGNNREKQFVQGVILEKNKYSWTTFIAALKNLYNRLN